MLSNIQALHEAGFKGQGIKVAVWDNQNDSVHGNHARLVMHVINTLAPEAKVDLIQWSGSSIKDLAKIKKGGYHFTNISMIGIDVDVLNDFRDYQDSIDSLFDETFVIAASGNSGDYRLSYPAATSEYKDKCLSCGAYYDHSGKAFMAGYTTLNEFIDIYGETGLSTPWGVFNGTSCAAPSIGSMLVCWASMFLFVNGRVPTIKEVNTEVERGRVKKVKNDPYDKGYYRTEVMMMDKVIKFNIQKESVEKTISANMSHQTCTINRTVHDFSDSEGELAYPFIDGIDDKMYVGVRWLCEELGATVDWNEETRECTITVPKFERAMNNLLFDVQI